MQRALAYGHLVEMCTWLIMIKTCSSAKPREKGANFTAVFQVEGQMVKGGQGRGQNKRCQVCPAGSLPLPQGEWDDSSRQHLHNCAWVWRQAEGWSLSPGGRKECGGYQESR